MGGGPSGHGGLVGDVFPGPFILKMFIKRYSNIIL